MGHSYLITFHTYGTWLRGAVTGSVDRHHNILGTPLLAPHEGQCRAAGDRMKQDPFLLVEAARSTVEQTIRDVCEFRGWRLLAVNIRSTHVHVVVNADAEPERIMNDLKAWCTRRLREKRVIDGTRFVWSRHGSTRWLNTPYSLERAIAYVLNEQGAELG